MKKGVLRNFTKFTGKHLRQSLFFCRAQACNFIQKETLTHVLSCEFCKILEHVSLTSNSGGCFCTVYKWIFFLYYELSQNKKIKSLSWLNMRGITFVWCKVSFMYSYIFISISDFANLFCFVNFRRVLS